MPPRKDYMGRALSEIGRYSSAFRTVGRVAAIVSAVTTIVLAVRECVILYEELKRDRSMTMDDASMCKTSSFVENKRRSRSKNRLKEVESDYEFESCDEGEDDGYPMN